MKVQRRIFRRKNDDSDAESRISFSSRRLTAKVGKPLPDTPHPTHWAQDIRPSQRRHSADSSFSSYYSHSRYERPLSFDSITGNLRGTIYPRDSFRVPGVPVSHHTSEAYSDRSSDIYSDDDTSPILHPSRPYQPEIRMRGGERPVYEDDYDTLSVISTPTRTYSGDIRPGMGVQRVQTREAYEPSEDSYASASPFDDSAANDTAELYANEYLSFLAQPPQMYGGGVRPGMGVQKRYTMTVYDGWKSVKGVEVDPAVLEEQQKKTEKELFEIYKKFWKQKGMTAFANATKTKGVGRKSHI